MMTERIERARLWWHAFRRSVEGERAGDDLVLAEIIRRATDDADTALRVIALVYGAHEETLR